MQTDADLQLDLQKQATRRWMNKTMNHSPRISPGPFEAHGKGQPRAFTSQNSPMAHSMIDAAREQQIKLLFQTYDLQLHHKPSTMAYKDGSFNTAAWSQPSSVKNIFGSYYQATDRDSSRLSSRQRSNVGSRLSKMRRLSQDFGIDQRILGKEHLLTSVLDQKKASQSQYREEPPLSPKQNVNRIDKEKIDMSQQVSSRKSAE